MRLCMYPCKRTSSTPALKTAPTCLPKYDKLKPACGFQISIVGFRGGAVGGGGLSHAQITPPRGWGKPLPQHMEALRADHRVRFSGLPRLEEGL